MLLGETWQDRLVNLLLGQEPYGPWDFWSIRRFLELIIERYDGSYDGYIARRQYYTWVIHAREGEWEELNNCFAVAGVFNGVKALLDLGIDPNYKDIRSDRTILMVATEQGHLDIARLAIERGCDVNIMGHWSGGSALGEAVWCRNIEMTRLLLNAGADTTVKNTAGRTIRDIYNSIVQRNLDERSAYNEELGKLLDIL